MPGDKYRFEKSLGKTVVKTVAKAAWTPDMQLKHAQNVWAINETLKQIWVGLFRAIFRIKKPAQKPVQQSIRLEDFKQRQEARTQAYLDRRRDRKRGVN